MANALTIDKIQNATPRERKYWLSDGQNGLHLLVMPDGSKYWKFRFRWHGKNDELTAAKPYPKTGLLQARQEARRLQVMVDGGINPREEKKATRTAARAATFQKFEEAANDWHAFRSRAWAVRSRDQVREYLDKDLIPALGKRSLDKISAQELADLLHSINERAPDVAIKTRQWLNAIFSYSRAKGWTTANPTQDIKAITLLGAPSRRYPHLPLDEMPEFLTKLK